MDRTKKSLSEESMQSWRVVGVCPQRMAYPTCEDGEGFVGISSRNIEAIIQTKRSHKKYWQCTVTSWNKHYV